MDMLQSEHDNRWTTGRADCCSKTEASAVVVVKSKYGISNFVKNIKNMSDKWVNVALSAFAPFRSNRTSSGTLDK